MRDAAKRVDKNYPTLTGVKRQREIVDACHDIIYDITFADLIIKDDGNYSTPWSKLDHPTLAAWGKIHHHGERFKNSRSLAGSVGNFCICAYNAKI